MTQLAEDENSTLARVLSSFLAIIFIALSWCLLFKFNEILFATSEFSKHISWIFLPAAIRMLSVMVFEWVGAVGLFIGAMITSDILLGDNFSTALVLSSLSALGPVFAVAVCSKWLGLSRTLSGLGPRQICLFALIGALFNVVPHNIYLYFAGHMQTPFTGLLPMLIGDLVGTAIVIYLTSIVLRLCLSPRKV